MHGFVRALFPTAVLMITIPPSVSAAPHPFNIRDLVAMDRLSEPVASPDGSRVALTISAVDLYANLRRSDIWVVGADGSGLRRLTDDPANDTSPVWHRDGRHVFFLSSRSGSSQVWRVDADSGETSQVTTLPIDVGAFKLSPDATTLLVSLEVYPDCATLTCTTGSPRHRRTRPPVKSTIVCSSAIGMHGRTAGARTCSSFPWPAGPPWT
jgi:dipeptidyl aminopeptidase/acylaminoacyl peptidase